MSDAAPIVDDVALFILIRLAFRNGPGGREKRFQQQGHESTRWDAFALASTFATPPIRESVFFSVMAARSLTSRQSGRIDEKSSRA